MSDGREPERLLALPEGPNRVLDNLFLKTGIRIHEPQFTIDGLQIGAIPRRTTYRPDIRYTTADGYLDWWRRGKEWFPRLEEWEEAIRSIHQFWQDDQRVTELYGIRDMRGVRPFIRHAEEMIERAPPALAAFRADHQMRRLCHDLGKGHYVAFMKDQYGIQLQERDLPAWKGREVDIPEHKGFKQLAILHDKREQPAEAITVCRQAVAIGWPGDWEARIVRYERRVKKLAALGSAPTKRQARAIHRFCTQCGSELDATDLFCGVCGTKRK